jgi:hypothetical protein
MSIPVAPGSYIYSHFKHVSGVPAPEGVRGVAINKLKILDVLIEQLSRIKNKPAEEFQLAGDPSDDRIDAMIDQYESQIRQAATAMPYRPSPSAATGALFSLVA